MIKTEFAVLRGRTGRGDEFEAAILEGLSVHAEDPDCLEVSLYRGVEDEDEFLIAIGWASIEAHARWVAVNRDRWRAFISELMDGTPHSAGNSAHFMSVGAPVKVRTQ